MVFANIFLNKEMINAKVLKKGFANINTERDEISIHIKTLREALDDA